MGGDEWGEGGDSSVGEEAVVSGFDFKGVLKGDLKGWERVFAAVFRRRRFEVWKGDMIEREVELYGECKKDCWDCIVWEKKR